MSDEKLTIEEFGPESRGTRLVTIIRRVPSPIQSARRGGSAVVQRLPRAIRASRTGAQATTGALRRLPDSTLRSIAAGSMAVGAGLYLAGKHRVAMAAGLVPAVIVGVAIIGRPAVPVAPADPKR
jgi:hypothetical protein